jgi:hypothetical protein
MKAKKARKMKEKEDVKKEEFKGMNPSDEIYVLARCKRNGESNKLEDCYGVPVSTYVDPCCCTTPTCCC